ncbi:MAG: A24 family peptidase C-terminal domain-containing protein [Candidatus ainarchaeum sp.]|nr:A24 family peptidase C-terminal domain-containing protein [Candidatus ainarchaeum sp.]MDD3975922.1 A24 family peptidase C-terminal domain-containing protein [Candidatus ainarchaeum sp.]
MNLLYLPIIIITILILIIISIQDIKKREINIFYLIFLVIFSIIYLWVFIFKNDLNLWYSYFYQLIIIFVFLLIIFILGKLSKFIYIGEGDLYTLFALSFTNIFTEFYILSIIILSLFITLLIPLFLFIYNLSTFNFPKKHGFFKSIILMFLGININIKKLNNFYYSLEKFSFKNNKLKYIISLKPNISPDKEIKQLKAFSKIHNIKTIWVSPLVPFVVSITLAYIFMFILSFYNIFNIFIFFL